MDHDDGHGEHESPATERTTAPQSPFTMGDVTTGFVVALIGMIVVFLIPLLLA
jgi:hypothetical protein